MADSKFKRAFRKLVSTEPLWGKAGDALSQLFPNAIKNGLTKHSRYILWALVTNKKTIVQLPRLHAKSTTVTFFYVMYCILTRRKKYILIVSSTGGQAVKFLLRIKVYLTSRKIKSIYGELDSSGSVVDTENQSFEDYVQTNKKRRSRIWNYKEIMIEPWGIRVMATSLSAANRGLLSIDDRPDLEIWDDVEDKKNTNTPELRQRNIETLWEELIPAGSVDCQFVSVGTISHFDSYLLKLRKAGEWFYVPLVRSTDKIENIEKYNDFLPEEFPQEYRFTPRKEYFTKDVVGLDDKNYKKGEETPEVAIWQDMYAYQSFCDRREESIMVGVEPSFWQEYYNIPKSKTARVFKTFKYIQKLRPKYVYGELVLESFGSYLFPNGKRVCNVYPFLGGDLAVSEKTSADWRSFCILFSDPFFNVYVLPFYRTKEPDPFVIGEWVLGKHNYYNFKNATFDGQNFQKWFGRIISYLQDTVKDENGKSKYKWLKVFQHPRSERKEEVIAATLAPLTSGGRLFFLGEMHEFENVVEELKNLGFYTSDDDADALTYGASELRYPPELDFEKVLPVGQGKIYHKTWMDELPKEGVAWFA